MMSSKTAMDKLWLRCETISDGKAMEKSRDYDEEVESKTMEKQWKNCGSDAGRK